MPIDSSGRQFDVFASPRTLIPSIIFRSTMKCGNSMKAT